MFEITYKDKERLNEYIENRKAYPNAVYDFTFENRFCVIVLYSAIANQFVAEKAGL